MPLLTIDDPVEATGEMRVYAPLKLAGRNYCIREGYIACYSQMTQTADAPQSAP